MKVCLERRLIGEILVERGAITREQLTEALETQRKMPGSYIGEVLIHAGLVSEIDIVTALVVQCNLPYIAISKHAIDNDVIRLIPADVACRERIVPLERIGSVLSVVMANPLDEAGREKVELLTGCKIAVFISTRDEIETALTRFYGKGH